MVMAGKCRDVKGLCGYKDYNPSNDFTGSDGVIYTDSTTFGNTWRINITTNSSTDTHMFVAIGLLILPATWCAHLFDGLYVRRQPPWSWANNASNFHPDDGCECRVVIVPYCLRVALPADAALLG